MLQVVAIHFGAAWSLWSARAWGLGFGAGPSSWFRVSFTIKCRNFLVDARSLFGTFRHVEFFSDVAGWIVWFFRLNPSAL